MQMLPALLCSAALLRFRGTRHENIDSIRLHAAAAEP